jgi:cell division transport system permease protein
MKRNRKQYKRRHGLQVVTLCISTTMVLVLLGIVVLSVQTARNLQRSLRENIEISVILSDTVNIAEGKAFGKQLESLAYAREVVYCSRDDALEQAKEEMGIDPSEFVGDNPFYSELTVHITADYANSDSLEDIATTLLKDKRVVDVTYRKDEVEGMNHILEPVSIALLVLAVLLIFICYTLISNSVQLSIYSRRFSIHTMKLVGASWGYIRRPFLRQSVAVGIISAVLACLLLGAIVYAVYPLMPDVEKIVTWHELVITAVCVFIFSFVIMVLCTIGSVNKFLKMTAGELYKI